MDKNKYNGSRQSATGYRECIFFFPKKDVDMRFATALYQACSKQRDGTKGH